MWPEIWQFVQQRIAKAHSEGYGVCVVDAAVMLMAGWNRHLHEIWVTIAPEKDVRMLVGWLLERFSRACSLQKGVVDWFRE